MISKTFENSSIEFLKLIRRFWIQNNYRQIQIKNQLMPSIILFINQSRWAQLPDGFYVSFEFWHFIIDWINWCLISICMCICETHMRFFYIYCVVSHACWLLLKLLHKIDQTSINLDHLEIPRKLLYFYWLLKLK